MAQVTLSGVLPLPACSHYQPAPLASTEVLYVYSIDQLGCTIRHWEYPKVKGLLLTCNSTHKCISPFTKIPTEATTSLVTLPRLWFVVVPCLHSKVITSHEKTWLTCSRGFNCLVRYLHSSWNRSQTASRYLVTLSLHSPPSLHTSDQWWSYSAQGRRSQWCYWCQVLFMHKQGYMNKVLM